MRAITVLLAAVFAAAAGPASAQPPPQPKPPPCTPAANVVCGQTAPEDLVALGPDWVAASSYDGSGGLKLIRVRDRMTYTAYPSASAENRVDAETYPDCPGPPDKGRLLTHGLYAAPPRGSVYKVFAVGHGAREAIEVFEIDTAEAMPAVTWIGCAVAPDPIGLNSVRGLSDGGFITTNFLPRGGSQAATQKMMAGQPNGELWEWHTASGWQKVPGSEAAGANGVELSADGKTIYMAEWGSRSLARISRGKTPPERRDVKLGFRVDNVHWARDGSLWAVGQGDQSWKAVKVDPRTLSVHEVLSRRDTRAFGAGTTVLEVGKNLWVGSFRGNRIEVIPAP
jgi:hypothetical protein